MEIHEVETEGNVKWRGANTLRRCDWETWGEVGGGTSGAKVYSAVHYKPLVQELLF
jgi:hypothetical protein